MPSHEMAASQVKAERQTHEWYKIRPFAARQYGLRLGKYLIVLLSFVCVRMDVVPAVQLMVIQRLLPSRKPLFPLSYPTAD